MLDYAASSLCNDFPQNLVELADVTGPMIAHQQPHGLGCAGQFGAVSELRQHVSNEFLDILGVMAEAGHFDSARETDHEPTKV